MTKYSLRSYLFRSTKHNKITGKYLTNNLRFKNALKITKLSDFNRKIFKYYEVVQRSSAGLISPLHV